MTTPRIISLSCLCVLALIPFAMCGCTSMNGVTNKWATAWKKSTEPKPVDPNREEVVTYWGQKKKEPKLKEMPPELKERLAKKPDDSQRSREYADNFKAGNQHLKEGRLDEARRAYEMALAARPDDPDVHHRLAVVADKQKLFGVADDHYEAALRIRPRDPNLLSDIGYSHVLRGDDRGAEKTLREALALDSSHRGAMLNLSTLYGKQRRYDEALALLRRGTTEAETQQYMTQLFPQGRPSDVALAGNQTEAGSRIVRTIPDEDRTDVRNMTNDQLKAEWDRRQLEESQNRQPQIAAGPTSKDWSSGSMIQDPRATQDPRSVAALNNQPWPTGQGSGDSSANRTAPNNAAFGPTSPYQGQTQGTTSMQPGAVTIPLPNDLQPGLPMSTYPGTAANGVGQRQGFAPNAGQGPLAAPPGTRPHSNIGFWQGTPAQPNAGAFNPNPSASESAIEQLGHTRVGAENSVSASQAAAQLGMSAGPGSLFPILSGDPASAGGLNGQPSRPQGFNTQSAPIGPDNQGRPWSQGNDGSNSGQALPNWQGAATSSSSSGVLSNFAGNDTSRAPTTNVNRPSRPWEVPANSPPSNYNTPSNVIQAGGLPNWGEPASRANESLDAYQSNTSANKTSRFAKSPWDESASQPNQAGGSRPYNGAWPSGNNQPNATSSGSGTSSNPLPMWNGGVAAGAASSSGTGSATANSANNSLPQWPYSSQR